MLATAWRRRFRRYPGDWIWPVLGLLIVAALAAAVGILATQGNDSPTKTRAETQASVPLSTGTAPTTSTPTDTSTLPTVPTTTAPEQPPPPPPSNTLIQWPAGQNGWTIVLSSIPQSGGREAAVSAGQKALSAGLDGRRNPRLVPVLEPAYGLLRGLHRRLRQRKRGPSRTRHGARQLSPVVRPPNNAISKRKPGPRAKRRGLAQVSTHLPKPRLWSVPSAGATGSSPAPGAACAGTASPCASSRDSAGRRRRTRRPRSAPG